MRMRPSLPGRISTKHPNVISRVTLPRYRAPTSTSRVRLSIQLTALREFSPETAAISTVPSSSTLISVPVSSWILRIIDPPLPMISRIFSGLILIVMIRGANSDISSRAEGLLEPLSDDPLGDALDLDVHLEGGDAFRGPGDLEVHVADRILLAEDVGQDHEVPG